MKIKTFYKASLLSIVFVLLLVACTASAATAESASPTITETQISTNGSASDSDIYGDRIVWKDNRNGNSDIYMYDLSTKKEIEISTNGSADSLCIYGDKIVWEDDSHTLPSWDLSDIHMYDLSTKKETQISAHFDEMVAEVGPAIYGDKIVWQDLYDEDSGISMYDLSTKEETFITADANSPAIYGDIIVWTDNRNANEGEWNSDIYIYDISTKKEERITTTSGQISSPDIYGDRIIWEDLRNGNWDIYMYDLSTKKETQVTTSISNQHNPVIYGNRIVWEGERNEGDYNTKSDIYMYDFSTSKETQITTSGSASSPAIYGDRIVWTDGRNGEYNSDIYMATLSSEEPEPIPPVVSFSASPTSGNAPLNVSFTDNSTGTPTAWNWNFGDGTNSIEKNPVHTYSKAGNYTVSLTVSNEKGSTSEILEIIVQEAKVFPVANFSANVTSGYAPLAVQFTDLSQNSVGRGWDFNNDWQDDFGEVAPVYVFTNPGTYNVNLIAINENGTATKTITITVQKENSNNQSTNGENISSGSSSSLISSNSSSSSGSSDSSSLSGSSDDSEQYSSGGSHHSSGGSGGGTGGSPEPQSNVATKDTAKVFVSGDKPVSFNFTNNVTVVDSISFTSEKTVGKTTAIVENLKNKSALVPELPEGIVYKSFNVWVGNGGYGDSENVLDTVISFKVEKSWVQENYINPSSIALHKYDDEKKEWVKLPVTLVSESNQFLNFTANVPGYSSFVITGEKGEQGTPAAEPVATVRSVNSNGNASTVASKIAENNEKAPGFGIVSGVVCLICISLYRINKK